VTPDGPRRSSATSPSGSGRAGVSDAPRRPLRTPGDLVDAGLVPATALPDLARVVDQFAVSLTPAVVDLIGATGPLDPHNAPPTSPIARQFVPDVRELDTHPAELADPIGDEAHSPVRGIVHRYPDRVLLKATSVCPVYCRFCFRREMVGPDAGQALDGAALDAALAYIADRPEVWEVILTGGDPLILSPRRLGEIVGRLDAIPHVGVVRFHTRVPVVDPGRVTPGLVDAIRARRAATWMLLHSNHADEFTADARAAIGRIVDAGIPMLGQSVLLRGVNDSVPALTGLFRAMVAARVKPHYLHHGDLARGTGHFRTTLAEGQALMRGLRGRVSGLCQPAYILDIPGGHGKVPVGPQYAAPDGEGWQVTDPNGTVHAYRDTGKAGT